MNNSQLMSFRERFGNLGGEANGLIRRQGTFHQAMLESLSLEQFHNQEVDTALMANVMQGADMGMRKPGHGFGFAIEALTKGGIGRQVRRQNFDGDVAIKTGVAGTIDLAHTASAEAAENFVRAELGARG